MQPQPLFFEAAFGLPAEKGEVARDLEVDPRRQVGERLHHLEEHEPPRGSFLEQADRGRGDRVRVNDLLAAGRTGGAAEREVGGLLDRIRGDQPVALDRDFVVGRLGVRLIAERAGVHPGEMRVVESPHYYPRGGRRPDWIDAIPGLAESLVTPLGVFEKRRPLLAEPYPDQAISLTHRIRMDLCLARDRCAPPGRDVDDVAGPVVRPAVIAAAQPLAVEHFADRERRTEMPAEVVEADCLALQPDQDQPAAEQLHG